MSLIKVKPECLNCGTYDKTKTEFYRCCVPGTCPAFSEVQKVETPKDTKLTFRDIMRKGGFKFVLADNREEALMIINSHRYEENDTRIVTLKDGLMFKISMAIDNLDAEVFPIQMEIKL